MEPFTISLDATAKEPLYRQLYSFIIKEIRSGALRAGEKLPSKRALAAHLQISRSTVETAYEMLAAEGYLRPVPKSGCYICPLDPLAVPATATPVPAVRPPCPPVPARYDFRTDAVDTAAFPFSAWARIARDVTGCGPDLLHPGDWRGDSCLREALAKYLHEFRGVCCTPEQIVVGAGMEYLLGLIVRLLGTARVYAMENPGYMRTACVLRSYGCSVRPVPLDTAGMSPDRLASSGASVAYLTPSHQFPMGRVMPAGRRAQLLAWARAEPERYLIEDDYDSEFRFNGRPIPAMQGLDGGARVIYMGTFSKSVAPSVRMAYAVLPPTLLTRCQERFPFLSSTVSRFEQHTLSRFLQEGHFTRHLNRMRGLYRGRRDTLLQALGDIDAGRGLLLISGQESGMHLLVQVHNGMTEEELIQCAGAYDVKVTGLSDYLLAPCAGLPACTVLLGYAGLGDGELLDAADLLKQAWKLSA